MHAKRHVLVEVSKYGREIAFRWLKEKITSEEQQKKIYQLMVNGYHGTSIPAIVRRKEETYHNDVLAVGLSSPFLIDGSRLRIPAFVPFDEIKAIVTPYEVLDRDFIERTKVLKLLSELRDLANLHHIEMGVWGSAGLEVYTGLPYTHECSDLDLIMKSTDLEKVTLVYSLIKKLGDKYNIKVDMELEIGDFEIRIAELFTETESILGKGIEAVSLYPRADVLKMIATRSDESNCSLEGGDALL